MVMASFKFLHTADVHLDSPLRGLSRYEGVPADEIRIATRTALNNLVDAAIEERVAFIIIAGDIYDGDWQHFGTGLFFCAAMGRLEKAGIDVFLLFGNHDAESVQTKKLPLPKNVRTFDTEKPATFIHEATATALHGWSYKIKDTRANLAASYPAALPNHLNIGVLHTALTGGRPPHAPYAPCSPAELSARGYHYWALGHVHDFELVSESPFIVFPGNLQGRNIRECGAKGAVIVTVEDGAIVDPPQPIPLDAVRWARVGVDTENLEHDRDIQNRVRDGLNQAFSEADGRPLVVRVTLTGRTALHGDLARRREQLREDIRGIAIAVSDQLWIEKVVVETEALSVQVPGAASVLEELGTLLASGSQDSALTSAFGAEMDEFLAKIPPDLGSDNDLLGHLRGGGVPALLEDAGVVLQAQLSHESD
jgi:DNA repair exonuclease SbcCD nuclease subunit